MGAKRIIVALDFPTSEQAYDCAEKLDPDFCRVKVGKELFTAAGPAVVKKLTSMGFEVFLDLKYHDIPNTVAGAVKAAANLGVWMVNVHAAGGPKMLEVTAKAAADSGTNILTVAVTVLTSMDLNDLRLVGTRVRSILSLVTTRARLAQQCGLDGVVASPVETKFIRYESRDGFLIVTPGIRLKDGAYYDQKRFATPEIAIKSGASHLVIGRPITEAADPEAALRDINRSIARA